MGALGVLCMVRIARDEDRRLIKRFGQAYGEYRASVPGMDLVTGVLRWLRRR